MRIRIVVSAFLAVGLAPLAVSRPVELAAQQQPANSTGQLIATAMATQAGSKYVPPACSADKNKHFKVGSGATYLKTAIEKSDPAIRTRALNDAERVITEAIRDNAQDKSPAAWYFLGRVRLHEGNVEGADSALVRAEQLAPDCKEEIGKLRRIAFAALANAGADKFNADQPELALPLFRQAAAFSPAAPQPSYYSGMIYYNQKRYDSAAVNFERALATPPNPSDPSDKDLRNKGNYFLGLALLRSNRPKEAIAPLKAFVAASPDDADGKKALANAYSGAGMADSAAAIQKELISGNGVAGGEVAATDAVTIGKNFYSQKQYADAVIAFQQGLSANPNDHEALYWLSFCYVGVRDGANLLKTAKQLAALDPMNEDVLKLVGEGYRITKQDAERQKAGLALLAMPVNVHVETFRSSGGTATLQGTATGRDAMGKTGAALKPAPVTLTFELLDGQGTVVGTQDVAVPALPKGQAHPFTVDAQGNGIVAWRYKKKAA